MNVDSGNVLADGTFIRGHDDWQCVQDMLHAGCCAGWPYQNADFLIE